MHKTIFKNRKDGEFFHQVPYLYTPAESVIACIIFGRRIHVLFGQDEIEGENIVRIIEFDWWEEPKAPSTLHDLFNQK